MIVRVFAALVCCMTLGLAPAQAHFIWIDIATADNGQPQARLYFSETPAPGEPHLIGKIAHTKAWARAPEGEPAPFKVERPEGDESGLLPLVGADPAAGSLEAVCDYGVYERGPAGVYLNYYAKRLADDWSKHADTLARAPGLALDVVPRVHGKQLELEVLYQGKPSGATEVIVVDPSGQEQALKTDDKGRVTVDAARGGRYAVRAAHIEKDKAGERDGKKYAQTWHYATLLVDVRPTQSESAASGSAADLLKRSREGRAVWQDFPGFSADLAISNGSEHAQAKASIDASGSVTLDTPPSKLADWVEEQLNTLVQHRMPEGEVSEGEVRFADEDDEHPLGRKINLGDGQDSAYRIKDDMIMEVNRSAGKVRFTISVLEFVRNAENKYLPRAFTMNFFDSASGQLKTSLGYWNDWQRVASFDLPRTILEISAHPGGTTTRQIVFSNCRLIEK